MAPKVKRGGATYYTFTKSYTGMLPLFTPSGTADAQGAVGLVTTDDNFLYVKTSVGWKRIGLTSF